MDKIVLRRDNVVKEVESEDLAAALEAKGFLRDGVKKKDIADPKALTTEMESIAKTNEMLEKRCDELETENAELKEKLAETTKYAGDCDKEIEELKTELSGTKEQLEAAIKKNNSKTKESK